MPVSLCDLLPHDHVEAARGLVAEHESCVVVVLTSVDEERSAEVDGLVPVVTCTRTQQKVKIIFSCYHVDAR